MHHPPRNCGGITVEETLFWQHKTLELWEVGEVRDFLFHGPRCVSGGRKGDLHDAQPQHLQRLPVRLQHVLDLICRAMDLEGFASTLWHASQLEFNEPGGPRDQPARDPGVVSIFVENEISNGACAFAAAELVPQQIFFGVRADCVRITFGVIEIDAGVAAEVECMERRGWEVAEEQQGAAGVVFRGED